MNIVFLKQAMWNKDEINGKNENNHYFQKSSFYTCLSKHTHTFIWTVLWRRESNRYIWNKRYNLPYILFRPRIFIEMLIFSNTQRYMYTLHCWNITTFGLFICLHSALFIPFELILCILRKISWKYNCVINCRI